jgi:hypothetical protein
MGKAIATAAFALAFAVLAASAGCVVEGGVSAPASGIAVSGPPPEPMREARPGPPDAQSVWVAGYWHWSGMQYTWIPGHWESAPAGASWRAPRYSIREGTYFYEPGGWSRRP